MSIAIEFHEDQLSRDYTEVATGGPTFDTGILGNPFGVQQRAVRRQDSIRTWDIQFEGLTMAQRLGLEGFFLTKFGGAIGFRFFPPSDYEFLNDFQFIGNGVATTFPLYRNYYRSGVADPGSSYVGFGDVRRRITKPLDNMVTGTPPDYVRPLTYRWATGIGTGATPAPTAIDTVNGTITFGSAPGTGRQFYLDGGGFDVPVIFDTDQFENNDYGVWAELQSIRVTEVLPVALGVTDGAIASTVTITGKCLSIAYAGISGCTVTLTKPDGTVSTATTNAFGVFTFTSVTNRGRYRLNASRTTRRFVPTEFTLPLNSTDTTISFALVSTI